MSHRSRYEGKNLLYLVLSFGVPILLLYFSFTAAFTVSETNVARQYVAAFTSASRILLILFLAAEFFCAWYLKRTFFPAASSPVAGVLRYLGVFVGALFCSICGAVACEAFGYDLFLRVMRRNG